MRPRCLGIISPVALMVIYASITWPSIEGRKVCFEDRDVRVNRTLCRTPRPADRYSFLSPTLADCCSFSSEQNLLYYVITNDPDWKLRVIGAFNCLSCTPEPTTQATCKDALPCPKGRVCKVKNGNTRCVCSGCRTEQDRAFQPVCATDGCTYKNECELRKKACRDGRPDLEVAYSGSCQTGCANVECSKNRTCMVDQYKRANCVDCNFRCSKQSRPVCGADGVRYESNCHLRLATCRQGKAIGVAYQGECIANASCDNINCGEKLCVESASGGPRCVTCKCEESYSSKCPRTPNPTTICGTNNKTYKDYCSLREEVCKVKAFIDVEHIGSCIGSEPPQEETSSPNDEHEKSSSKSCKSDDIDLYYLSLKHFVSILRKEYGLNITSPKYRQLRSRDKIVLMAPLIQALKNKWHKIKEVEDFN
ncbi:hypothetical protein OS493_035584 [Desmophyllum pertusum]|uniref:Kazal-like domain-containing protein n=1 Tax=Desmophyllum pertusum TaxID=174260 RepID=A0A9X0D6N7_9CNID|nr:hypothetical protein OS493_035584 [Desmophyllum pertusum]